MIDFFEMDEKGMRFVRTLRREDIERCPFMIIVAEHYRIDGSCRCDDAEHRAFMIEEWEYSPSDFVSIPLRKE